MASKQHGKKDPPKKNVGRKPAKNVPLPLRLNVKKPTKRFSRKSDSEQPPGPPADDGERVGLIAWGAYNVTPRGSLQGEDSQQSVRAAGSPVGSALGSPGSPERSPSLHLTPHAKATAGGGPLASVRRWSSSTAHGETPSWLSSESTASARTMMRLSEREEIVQHIDVARAQNQRARLSFHVRKRRSQLQRAMEAEQSHRPPPGRPCYFTEGHVSDAERRDVNNEPSPYWMPPAAQELCFKKVNDHWQRERIEKERKAPFYEHYNSCIRDKLDLLPRLHLPRDTEDPANVTPGILDIDPDFFSIVEGRPENAANLGRLDIRKYLSDMREVLVTKLMIGYSDDHCLLVEEQYTQELKVIKNIQHQHHRHVKAFEAFLAEDHEKSMEILQKADSMTAESKRMEAELRGLNRTLGRLRNEVVILEDKWRSVKNLQRFLYAASPRMWRLAHDYEYQKRIKDSGSDTSIEDVVYGNNMNVKEVRSDTSLSELIEMFHEEVDNQPPPELYFKTPRDLLDVFDTITHLNMDMMLHAEQVRKPLEELFHTLQDARKHVQEDTEKLRNSLKEKKETIEWEEKRAAGLQADARRLLEEVFKELIIDDRIIRIRVCVEDAYEIVVGPNDNNLTVVEMMQEVERAYEKLADDLDSMPPNILATTQDDVDLDEKIGFMKAKIAAKQLAHIHRLETRLHNSMLTPPRAGMRPLMWRSPPFVRYVAKRKSVRKLSEIEKMMLIHLTDYCIYKDDPAPYLEELKATGMYELLLELEEQEHQKQQQQQQLQQLHQENARREAEEQKKQEQIQQQSVQREAEDQKKQQQQQQQQYEQQQQKQLQQK